MTGRVGRVRTRPFRSPRDGNQSSSGRVGRGERGGLGLHRGRDPGTGPPLVLVPLVSPPVTEEVDGVAGLPEVVASVDPLLHRSVVAFPGPCVD